MIDIYLPVIIIAGVLLFVTIGSWILTKKLIKNIEANKQARLNEAHFETRIQMLGEDITIFKYNIDPNNKDLKELAAIYKQLKTMKPNSANVEDLFAKANTLSTKLYTEN